MFWGSRVLRRDSSGVRVLGAMRNKIHRGDAVSRNLSRPPLSFLFSSYRDLAPFHAIQMAPLKILATACLLASLLHICHGADPVVTSVFSDELNGTGEWVFTIPANPNGPSIYWVDVPLCQQFLDNTQVCLVLTYLYHIINE